MAGERRYLLAGGPAMNAAKGLLAGSNVAKLGGAGQRAALLYRLKMT